ncbi:MAG: cadmium-translocating P-type ATPase [Alphaproteobacteria bacterium]|nr:cadmium-translocating P-type ATPase [Alphaproteobacteria bacterium]
MSAALRAADPQGDPAPSIVACTWCGTEVELSPRRAAALVAAPDAGIFCCSGCEAAAAMVHGAGLDQYFDKRDALPPRPGLARSAGWDRIAARPAADGTLESTLHVDGLRCAACTWVTEKVLLDSPGVVDAHVSYGTGTAIIRWAPGALDGDTSAPLTEALTRVSRLGYRPRALDTAAKPDRDLLMRMGVAVFATMNVMMIQAGVYLGWISGMEDQYALFFRWITLILATPVALYSAAPFFRGAWEGLRNKVLHMDLPIALAVGGMYGHGLYATMVTGSEGWLDSMTMLVALLLAGRFLEQAGRRRAAEAAQALAAEAPAVARRVTPTGIEEVAPTALSVGELIEVGAGEELAADGEVVAGSGRVQLALLTGESEPLPVGPGSRVIAGGVMVDGHLRVRVESAVGESLLARMAELLRDAAARPPSPTAADKLAPWFTGLTLAVAGGTFAVHLHGAGFEPAVEAAVAVLVVACPCALALATPLAAHAGLGAAARRGLLLRSGDAVRRTGQVDLVALDKTGTVTWGRPRVVAADDHVLRIAAAIERASVHPMALAIVDEAVARGIPIPLGEDIVEEPGRGIRGCLDGRCWRIRGGGAGVVEVVAEETGGVLGRIHLKDRIRDEVRVALDALRADGVDVALVTGDHADVAAAIAEQAGIRTVLAAQTPEDKAAWIGARAAEGRRVMFVGDGLNDGPALAAAHVGIAMGHGAASSVLVADGVLIGGQLSALRAGLVAARHAAAVTRVNVARSIAYNVGAVGFALAGLVNPLVAAVLMPLSSGLVIAGALSVEHRTRRTLG